MTGNYNNEYDNLLGEIIAGGYQQETACFGNEACQERRDFELQRQREEQELLMERMRNAGAGKISTRTLVLMGAGVLGFIMLIVLIKLRK